MNKEDKYLWDTAKLVAYNLNISTSDLVNNFDEIVQQLYGEFFIELGEK